MSVRQASLQANARARANIALAKYWGKLDPALNLPDVPSISVTLDPLVTETSVEFASGFESDSFVLDGKVAPAPELGRVAAVLDRVRERSDLSLRARVESRNRFPTASGLASSASGFAALAAAASRAAGLDLRLDELSALARGGSASAARSIFGGYVYLPAGRQPGQASRGRAPRPAALAAEPLAPAEHWDLRVVVAVVSARRKPTSSRLGMTHTKRTSPYYAAWKDLAAELCAGIRRAVLERDLTALGQAAEHSALSMHACALAAAPALLYWQPGTVAALHRVRELRERQGIEVWATVDAGPHVKALCRPGQAEPVARALGSLDGITQTLLARPGPGVETW